jgi:tetraacyldisaccharide 4'-kinase
MDELRKELRVRAHQGLFFTTTSYADPKRVFDNNSEPIHLEESEKGSSGVVLVTGIASPLPLKLYLQQYFREIIHLSFPDHHYFDSKDLRRIGEAYESIKSSRKLILTTSKDAVRLREFSDIDPELKKAFFYIPVSASFLGDGKSRFDKTIFDYVGKNIKDSPVP